jgi:hypothetical protein
MVRANMKDGHTMKRRFAAVALLLAGMTAPSLAWSPPAVGTACRGTRGPGPERVAIAGNYLGGRPIRHGIVDRKSFQGCFHTTEACERWLAGKAAHYPLQPGFATCTRVTLR